MRPRARRALARVYRLSTRPPRPEQPVEVEPGLTVPRFVLEWSQLAPEEARRTLDRFPVVLGVRGASVLAVGRGAADVAIELARRGARRAVAVDLATRRMRLAQRRLAQDPLRPPVAVEMRPYAGSLAELGDERFALVVADDAFRSYGEDAARQPLERMLFELADRTEPGGHVAVHFGPPWKAPNGGGLDSRVPWAHLLFPEPVIFDEFRRTRSDSAARSFDDIGVNRITLGRFRRGMESTGLELVRLDTNVGGRRMAAVRALARVPGLDEHLTLNVYGVWRRPAVGDERG